MSRVLVTPIPSFSYNMDSTVKYLLSLQGVRERASTVGDAALAGRLNHFDFHEDRMADVADFVASVIKVRDSLKSV